jgi:hypothetical protein
MTRAQIIATQTRVGTEPDGFWGPRSIAACQRHLRGMMPTPNPWPLPGDAAMTRFFGKAGDESTLVNLPVNTLDIRYLGQTVNSVRCNAHVADSLSRVLGEISDGPYATILHRYAGCFNYRKMRGGSRPSKHAWGAAIDLDPGTNGLRTSWPVTATMPIEVMECFSREGWLSAGAFWGRDGMHFQSTR